MENNMQSFSPYIKNFIYNLFLWKFSHSPMIVSVCNLDFSILYSFQWTNKNRFSFCNKIFPKINFYANPPSFLLQPNAPDFNLCILNFLGLLIPTMKVREKSAIREIPKLNLCIHFILGRDCAKQFHFTFSTRNFSSV
jgi:hypothetical protein